MIQKAYVQLFLSTSTKCMVFTWTLNFLWNNQEQDPKHIAWNLYMDQEQDFGSFSMAAIQSAMRSSSFMDAMQRSISYWWWDGHAVILGSYKFQLRTSDLNPWYNWLNFINSVPCFTLPFIWQSKQYDECSLFL